MLNIECWEYWNTEQLKVDNVENVEMLNIRYRKLTRWNVESWNAENVEKLKVEGWNGPNKDCGMDRAPSPGIYKNIKIIWK